MGKYINFRAFLFAVIAVVMSCITAILSCVSVLGTVLFFILFTFIAGAVIVVRAKFGVEKYFYTAVICLFLSAITFVNCINIYDSWTYDGFENGKTYELTGVIDSISDYGPDAKIVLRDVIIDGNEIDGNLSFYQDMTVNGYIEVKVGYKAFLTADVYSVPLISDTVNGSAYRNDLRYTAYPAAVDFLPSEMNFLDKVHGKIYDSLTLAMGQSYGSIAYGMFTGNKGVMDSDINDNFSASGLGHILAVSGLHIGFLITLLTFFLRLIKVKRVVAVPVISALLLFYAWFVGFTPSVMRAVFMSILGMLSVFAAARKDILNTMFFAASVLIAANPFYLFEAGFLMSFGAVFGIALFAPVFERLFARIKLPKFIRTPLSSGIAVQIGVLPATVYFFNFIQVYALIVNIVMIPLLSILYMAIVICVLLTLIFPFGKYALMILGYAIGGVDFVAEFVAGLPFSTVTVFSFVGVFLCYPLYFVISECVNIPRFKIIVSGVLSGVCIALTVIPTASLAEVNRAEIVAPIESYGEVTSIVTDADSNVYLIGDARNYNAVRSAMTDLRFSEIKYVFVYEVDDRTGAALRDIVKKYNVQAVYCPSDGFNDLSEIDKAIEVLKPLYEYDGDTFKPVFYGNAVCGYVFNAYSNLLTVKYGIDYDKIDADVINGVSVLRVFAYLNAYPDRIYITDLPSGYFGEYPRHQISTADEEFLTLSLNNGKIYKV